MKELWTFTTKEKLDKFIERLNNHDIGYEVTTKNSKQYVVLVSEGDFVNAKRVLLKHKERRTSGDSM